MIRSTDVEKTFGKSQQAIMILKNSQRPRNKWGKFLNYIHIIYKKTRGNIKYNGERVNAFPLRSGTKQGCPLLLFFFNILLEFLAHAIRQEKRYRLDRNKTVIVCG